MRNKVLAIDAELSPTMIQKTINDELAQGWLVD